MSFQKSCAFVQRVSGRLYTYHQRKAFISSSCLYAKQQQELQQQELQTVQEVVEKSIAKLQHHGVPEPDSSVHHLLAHALPDLDYQRGFLTVRSDETFGSNRRLSSDEYDMFQELLDRRLAMEPLQYIVGQWDFLEYTLYMQPPLLCPRPETEELVMMVVEASEKEKQKKLERILDIGCGTGAIGIALADMIPDTFVTAIDIDPVAVHVSNNNAQRVLDPAASRYQALECRIQDFSPDNDEPLFDIVVSNPPYIPRLDMETLSSDVVSYESDQALCGGEDGLDVVRVILKKLPSLLRKGGSCWMEVDPTHPNIIRDMLLHKEYPFVKFDSTLQDLYGKDRFVKLAVVADEQICGWGMNESRFDIQIVRWKLTI